MATLSTAAKNAALDGIRALLISGGSRAGFRDSGGQQLTLFTSFAWSAASGGSMSASTAIVTQQVLNTGAATKLSIMNSGLSTEVIAMTAGGPGSGQEVEISPSANITTGLRVRINSLTLSIV